MWLAMIGYSGPYPEFDSSDGMQAHRHYLRYAALAMLFRCAQGQTALKIALPAPLTVRDLSSPWKYIVGRFDADGPDTVRAYVTHIDGNMLDREFVVYGTEHSTRKAYERSNVADRAVREGRVLTDPSWLVRYFIPQRELALASVGDSKQTAYKGNVAIRKITDLDGHDLPFVSRDPYR
jgi:hypothetical protein